MAEDKPDPRLIAAQERTMAERLELAVSWNLVASELRLGMDEAKKHPAGA